LQLSLVGQIRGKHRHHRSVLRAEFARQLIQTLRRRAINNRS
jgi:hypothetical protein